MPSSSVTYQFSANDNVPPQMVNVQPQKGAIRPAINVFTITLIFRKGATRPAINAFTIMHVDIQERGDQTSNKCIHDHVDIQAVAQTTGVLVTEATCILQVTPPQLPYSN